MKTIRRILTIAGLAVLLALPAFAGLEVPMPIGNTNWVAYGATTNYVANGQIYLVDFSKTTDATLMLSALAVGTNTTSATINFDSSADTVTWQTNALTVTGSATGGQTMTIVTNLPAGIRAPYMRLNSWVEANGSGTNYWTNLVFKAFGKTGF